jgi:hypothetical protein
MMATKRLISLLLFAAFALLATAAPPRSDSDSTIKQVVHRRIPAPVLATPTRNALASACTNGMPASKQHPAGYPINNYTVVTPGDNTWTSYAVRQDWFGDHFISGPHVSFHLCKRLGI